MVRLGFPQELLDKSLSALAVTLNDFEIKPKEANLAIYDGGNVLDRAITAYLNCKRVENCSPRSINYWSHILPLLLNYVRMAPADYTSFDIRTILAMHQQKHTITGATLNKYKTILNGFFQWLVDEEMIPRNPCKPIKAAKVEKKEQESLTQMDLEIIRNAISDPRHKMLIEMLYSTGGRASEIVGIKLSDIDWSTNTAKVIGKGNKERTVYLNAKAVIAVHEYLKIRGFESEWLFAARRKPHGQAGYAALYKDIKEIDSLLPVKLKYPLHPHLFRHTTATIAMANGMAVQDIQMLLGHASISTTMIYAKTNQQQVQSSHDKFVI